MFLEKLIDKHTLVVSYYYTANLTLLLNFASILHRKKGTYICIANYGKIKWELYPYELDFPIKCDDNASLLVFEAESEREVPEKFVLVTSYKNLKINATKVRIEKINSRIYKAIFEDYIEAFKINNGRIEEVKLDDALTEILRIISELGEEVELKDVVNIVSKKLELTKEEVREKLLFLQELNKIEIKDKKIRLIQ